jgi:hypothetical protein
VHVDKARTDNHAVGIYDFSHRREAWLHGGNFTIADQHICHIARPSSAIYQGTVLNGKVHNDLL